MPSSSLPIFLAQALSLEDETDQLSTSSSSSHYLPPFSSHSHSSSSNSSTQCPDDALHIGNFTINNYSLVLPCFVAALVGITGFLKIRRTNVIGSFSYSISFLMFACMMSDAMFVHCFFYNVKDAAASVVDLIDVGLTSCVAVSFFWNGLVDLRVVDENKCSTRIMMLLSYISVFVAWIYTFEAQWERGFFIFYVCLIFFSCGIFVCTELIALCVHKGRGIFWLLIAGIYGGSGLAAAVSSTFSLWLCNTYGPTINGEFVWFVASDFAMISIFKYFMITKEVSSERNTATPKELKLLV